MKNLNMLGRAEMKQVKGGRVAKDLCVLTVTYANGGVGSGDYVTDDANALCVHWITTGQVASCGYDCSADGWGH